MTPEAKQDLEARLLALAQASAEQIWDEAVTHAVLRLYCCSVRQGIREINVESTQNVGRVR